MTGQRGEAHSKVDLYGAYVVGDWLTIHGGTAAHREEIERGFTGELFETFGNTVELLAEKVQARITVVFSDAVSQRSTEINQAVLEPNTYLVVLVDRVELVVYRQALAAGADGVAHVDSPIEHLCDIAKSALRHDITLPKEIVRSMATTTPPAVEELTAMSTDILRCLDRGMNTNQIAAELNFSVRTARRRIHNLCLTLGVAKAENAVGAARRKGLYESPRVS